MLVAAVLIAALASPACAQTRLAVNITDVTVEQLTNGLRLTLKADGLLQVHTVDPWSQTNAQHEFNLDLRNARSAVGTFVDISRYPVNYLKLETPQDAREGVGVRLTVKLYRDGHVRSVELDNARYDWTWSWSPGEVAYDLRKGRSGNELVITVWSDRREILPTDRKPRHDQGLPEELSLRIVDGMIEAEALNVPLQRLMSELASETGQSIYVSDRVERLATLRLERMPIERFVPAIASSLGLTAILVDGAWYVSDGLPSSLAPYTAGDSRIFRLNYLGAEDAISLLPEFLLRYLRPSPTNDAIIAHGPRRLLDRIEEDLSRLDRAPRAVRVRTAMVEASSLRARQLMWSVLRGGSTPVEFSPGDGRLRISHDEEPQEELVAQLQALATENELSVYVRPSLLVQEGQHARLFAGVRQYFQFLRRGEVLELTSTEAGVSLSVRPQAVGDQLIQAYVVLDVSTIRGIQRPPVIDSRQASATLLLGSGESMIVAGGLVDVNAFRDRGGIAPIASAVPGTARKSEQIREVVFLIGAEVVPGSGHDAEEELAWRRDD
jgi:hypothetical protein